MGTVHIPTLLEGILEATAAEAAAKARITTIRAALEAEGRRRLEEEGAAPSWHTPQLGKVRLEPAGDWTATIDDAPTFASYLAEHHPTEVTATVTLNVTDLEDALKALEFIGAQVSASRLDVRPAWLPEYLKGLAVDVEEERDASHQLIRTVIAADTTTGDVVPGIGVTRSEAKLVVSLDRDRRTAAITEARTAATALVEEASDDAEAAAVDLAALDVRRRELEDLTVDQLARIAKAHRLGSSGTKAALAERIARAEQADGLVVGPASELAPLREVELEGRVVDVTPSPLPEGTEVEEVSTVPLDQPVEEVPDGGDVADTLTISDRLPVGPVGLRDRDEEEARELAALAAEVEAAPVVVDNRRAHLDQLSREVLRQHAKAIALNPGGTKGDLLDRLVEAGVTVTAVNDTARKARAS